MDAKPPPRGEVADGGKRPSGTLLRRAEGAAGRKPSLTLLVASPRGFCAGVERAIEIVDRALAKYGAPIYVHHEIVHNRYVVEGLRRKGAVFVEEVAEVPDDARVVFSAHGAPRRAFAEAGRRHLDAIDATCPLVNKVHAEARRYHADGRLVLLVGHAGHPEIVGTVGQLPPGAVLLVEDREKAKRIAPARTDRLAYITQTTLSVEDVEEIVAVLTRRFPGIVGPRRDDICYATGNRQQAVKRIAPHCDALLVVGAANSSNSNRLVEVARKAGCPRAYLIARASHIPWERLRGVKRLGLTAGASAPEILVREVIEACRRRYEVALREVAVCREDTHFNVPHALGA